MNPLWEDMKRGDVIWQNRQPGGYVIVVRVFDNEECYDGDPSIWTDHDYPLLRVLHSTEGLIDDPSYYYQTLELRKYVDEQSKLVGDVEIYGHDDSTWKTPVCEK